ncbi:unnamed protein product [Toxocara canis]|uniref:Secreted protein n=1 Tax=Toxocara canis TaxID=6265 RepID=A0A183V1V1_TOXCA|nr:unnamed protein product [Toxocara canis]
MRPHSVCPFHIFLLLTAHLEPYIPGTRPWRVINELPVLALTKGRKGGHPHVVEPKARQPEYKLPTESDRP